MRQLFLESLPDFVRSEDPGTITKEFSMKLITPMFGGDSESWVLNRSAPVRAPSVKGQLRFWWRTLKSEMDHRVLLATENVLWGGKVAKNKRIQSRVKIAVTDQKVSKQHQAELNDKGFAVEDEVIPAYVAFPITSAIKNENKDVRYAQELSFTLRASYPKDQELTVLNTLKLWVLFGGVGARTRRGCGSLYCEELLRDFEDENAIGVFVRSIGSGEQAALPYPRIFNSQLAVNHAGGNPEAAWKSLMESYASFRQDRVPRKPTPGRSYWPEPDAIRILVGKHAPLHTPEHPDGLWFPRAAFGLPIITKFNTKGNGHGDPDPQVELLPNIGTRERWPSPVILKVIRLPNGKVLKAALVLNQSFPEALVLKQKDGQHFSIPQVAHPFAPEVGSKIMKNKEGKYLSPGESLYQALFKALGLKEVK